MRRELERSGSDEGPYPYPIRMEQEQELPPRVHELLRWHEWDVEVEVVRRKLVEEKQQEENWWNLEHEET